MSPCLSLNVHHAGCVLVVGACLSPRKGAATADTALLPGGEKLGHPRGTNLLAQANEKS